MIKVPPVTLAIAATCTLIALGDWFDLFVWERDAQGWWRALTAPFTHYNASHLLPNLLALLVAGTLLEGETSSILVALILVVTVAISGLMLEMHLLELLRYSGVSTISFAMTGALAVTWWRRSKFLVISGIALLGGYELLSVLMAMNEPVRPVWQLHLLAFCIGAILSAPSVLTACRHQD